MNKFWRIALAWLLAVALPIQGYAAQTLMLCGPAHHQRSVMDGHAAHGHDHGAMAHADMAHAETHADASDVDKTPPAKSSHAGKCSACSSCCNAAALTTTVLSFAVAPPDLPQVPTIELAYDRVMVGGLERPPRLSRS